MCVACVGAWVSSFDEFSQQGPQGPAARPIRVVASMTCALTYTFAKSLRPVVLTLQRTHTTSYHTVVVGQMACFAPAIGLSVVWYRSSHAAPGKYYLMPAWAFWSLIAVIFASSLFYVLQLVWKCARGQYNLVVSGDGVLLTVRDRRNVSWSMLCTRLAVNTPTPKQSLQFTTAGLGESVTVEVGGLSGGEGWKDSLTSALLGREEEEGELISAPQCMEDLLREGERVINWQRCAFFGRSSIWSNAITTTGLVVGVQRVVSWYCVCAAALLAGGWGFLYLFGMETVPLPHTVLVCCSAVAAPLLVSRRVFQLWRRTHIALTDQHRLIIFFGSSLQGLVDVRQEVVAVAYSPLTLVLRPSPARNRTGFWTPRAFSDATIRRTRTPFASLLLNDPVEAAKVCVRSGCSCLGIAELETDGTSGAEVDSSDG